jgi:phosphate butyryltransferase
MQYKNFDEIIERALKAQRLRPAVVAGAAEHHVLESMSKAWKEKVIQPYFVGEKGKIIDILKDLGEKFPEEYIVDCPADEKSVGAKSVELLREGKASFLVKGLIETSTILKALLNKETGLPAGRIATHLTLVALPNYPKIFGLTDAAILINPDLEQKKNMLLNAVTAFRSLGYEEPKVALLTPIEKVNPKMQDTVDAAAIKEMWAKGELPNCQVEGPISFDLTFDRESAITKGFTSPVVGDPDILILPNITAANVLVKALGFFANATSAGMVLGAKVPMVLTSRGTSIKNKYTAAVVVSEMSANWSM